MEWSQVWAIVGSNIALFLWVRTESRADYRHSEARTEALVEAIRQDVEAIRQDVKDFHGRLCAIEERQRVGNKKD